MKRLITLLGCLCIVLSCFADDYLYPVSKAYNEQGKHVGDKIQFTKTTPINDCHYFLVHYIPPFSGNPASLLFFFQEKAKESEGHLPAVFTQKGKSNYRYTLFSQDGKIYREIQIREMKGSNVIIFKIDRDFAGNCDVRIVNEETLKSSEAVVSAPNGANLFKTVAQLIEKIGFAKTNDCLYFDW